MLDHIDRSTRHNAAFRERGLKVGSWAYVSNPDLPLLVGIIWTLPGGDEQGRVSLGVNGASQFGMAGCVSASLYDLAPFTSPRLGMTPEQLDAWLSG